MPANYRLKERTNGQQKIPKKRYNIISVRDLGFAVDKNLICTKQIQTVVKM